MKYLEQFVQKLGLRSLKDDARGFVDVGVAISLGILFAGLMIIAYIIWTLQAQLITTESSAAMNSSILTITNGFDDMITLLLIVVVVWLLALAIMALLVIKKRAE